MERGILKYIFFGDTLEDCGTGVSRKVTEQIKIFNIFGLNCKLCVLSLYSASNKIFGKCLRRMPFFNTHKHWRISDFIDEDFLYIRSAGGWDAPAIRFFKRLKEIDPTLKIVYEIPTYPYDGELAGSWKMLPILWKDKWNRRYLNSFIDRIATLTDDKEIFGVPTLKIGNGINVEKIRPRKIRETSEIHAIAVSICEWWHGYDRFIEGLRLYYEGNPQRKIVFHLVGQGSESERYKKMVQDYGLEEYVIMYGQQTGEALDNIYDQCNLGIASLGCYRKGMYETQELKTREYAAKGLPFITSVTISDIPQSDKSNIYLKVPNDDTPIDMHSVLNFYDHIYINSVESVNKRLRQYAKEHFSMEEAMKEVVAFFKQGT